MEFYFEERLIPAQGKTWGSCFDNGIFNKILYIIITVILFAFIFEYGE
jgi:hypothetical protein